jgi:hypothetical protein
MMTSILIAEGNLKIRSLMKEHAEQQGFAPRSEKCCLGVIWILSTGQDFDIISINSPIADDYFKEKTDTAHRSILQYLTEIRYQGIVLHNINNDSYNKDRRKYQFLLLETTNKYSDLPGDSFLQDWITTCHEAIQKNKHPQEQCVRVC